MIRTRSRGALRFNPMALVGSSPRLHQKTAQNRQPCAAVRVILSVQLDMIHSNSGRRGSYEERVATRNLPVVGRGTALIRAGRLKQPPVYPNTEMEARLRRRDSAHA